MRFSLRMMTSGVLSWSRVLQTVVAVDDAAIKIVQIGSRKTAAFERHERAQVRRNHRQHRRESSIPDGSCDECKPWSSLMRLASFLRICLLLVSVIACCKFDRRCLARSTSRQRFAHGFRAHLGDERFRAVGFARFAIFVFAEQLMLLQRRLARINHEVILVIDHALEMARGHVQHQADARRHALEEPDVRHRHGQFDVAHALAAHARQRHFDAATVADDAAMLDALVFAAGAFPVLDRAENAFAEQAALFRLERAVIDGFGILDFALAPGADGVGRRDA